MEILKKFSRGGAEALRKAIQTSSFLCASAPLRENMQSQIF
jgi:hypothetical protein